MLLAGIRTTQEDLGKPVDERCMGAEWSVPPAPGDLAQFMASLMVVWLERDRRPTHRRLFLRIKPVVRTWILDAALDQLLAWLEAKLALSTVDALERLRCLYPERFSADHPRTVQGFIKMR